MTIGLHRFRSTLILQTLLMVFVILSCVFQARAEESATLKLQVVIPAWKQTFKVERRLRTYIGELSLKPVVQVTVVSEEGNQSQFTHPYLKEAAFLKLDIDDESISIQYGEEDLLLGELENNLSLHNDSDMISYSPMPGFEKSLNTLYELLNGFDPSFTYLRYSRSWNFNSPKKTQASRIKFKQLPNGDIEVHFPEIMATTLILRQSTPPFRSLSQNDMENFEKDLELHDLALHGDLIRGYLGYPSSKQNLNYFLKQVSEEQAKLKIVSASPFLLTEDQAKLRMHEIKKWMTSIKESRERLSFFENQLPKTELVESKRTLVAEALQDFEESFEKEAKLIAPFLPEDRSDLNMTPALKRGRHCQTIPAVDYTKITLFFEALADKRLRLADFKIALSNLKSFSFAEKEKLFQRLAQSCRPDLSLIALLDTVHALKTEISILGFIDSDRIRFNRPLQDKIIKIVPYSVKESIYPIIPLTADDPDFQARLINAFFERFKPDSVDTKTAFLRKFLQIDPISGKILLDPLMGRAAFLNGVMTLPQEERLPFLVCLELLSHNGAS